MHALTLWPEWAAAVAYLGKDVENRSWQPAAKRREEVIGARICIHAGQRVGGGLSTSTAVHQFNRDLMYRLYPPALIKLVSRYAPEPDVPPNRSSRFALVNERKQQRIRLPVGGVIATARLVGIAIAGDDPSLWASKGCWWWQLADVRTLPEPIPCRGNQGLWRVPEVIQEAVEDSERVNTCGNGRGLL